MAEGPGPLQRVDLPSRWRWRCAHIFCQVDKQRLDRQATDATHQKAEPRGQTTQQQKDRATEQGDSTETQGDHTGDLIGLTDPPVAVS